MEFDIWSLWILRMEFEISIVNKKIKLGSPKLDEPGIGSKAKYIPSFDLNLEKLDDVPRLIENDLEHKNVQFSDSTKKYDLRIESRNVHNTKVDINDTNVFMDHFEDYQKTNPDELLYELQEKMVKAQIKAKAMPEQERISDSQFGVLPSKIWFGSIEKDYFSQVFSKLIISSSVPSTPYMGFDMKNRASDYMLYKRRFFEDIMGNLNLEKDYEEIFKENAKKLDELQENIELPEEKYWNSRLGARVDDNFGQNFCPKTKMSTKIILDVISRFMNLISEKKTSTGHLQMV